jgi:hypothetical protein
MLKALSVGEFLQSYPLSAIATVVSTRPFRLRGRRRAIASEVTFNIEQKLRGDWEQRFTGIMPGGTLDGITMEAEDQPIPAVGKQVILLRHEVDPNVFTLSVTGNGHADRAQWRDAYEREGTRHPLLAKPIHHFIEPPGDPTWPGKYPTTATVEIWDNTSDLGAESAFDAIQRAINTWNMAGANFSFRRVVKGGGLTIGTTEPDKRNIIRWSPGPPAAIPNALAATSSSNDSSNNFTDADIQYFENGTWSTNPNNQQNDVESVALHELGHFLGAVHSTTPGDVMFPTIGPGVQRRVLAAGDVAQIQGLYGARRVAPWVVNRWWNGRDHFYSTQAYGELAPDVGYTYEGSPFQLFAPGTPGTTRFFRWFHPVSGDHFYTTNANGELAPTTGYVYEGDIGNIALNQIANTIPLFRWFNPATSDHFYTTDANGELAPISGYVKEPAPGQPIGFVRP